MEKFVALKETGVVKVHPSNNANGTGCHERQERLKPGLSKDTDNNTVNILQLYYAALIQCHSCQVSNKNPEVSYLHGT